MQVLAMIWMLNELIQANQMVFMKSWTIEQYGASFGDDIDAKRTISRLFNVFCGIL